MNEVERLLAVDRATPIPEAPDLRYTEVAVMRRLGRLPAQTRAAARAGARGEDWPLLAAAVIMVLPIAGALHNFGLNLRWLLYFPVVLLALSPILLAKEHGRL
jgi:hypothetical protein